MAKRPSYPEPILVGYTVGVVEAIDNVIEMPSPPGNYGAEAAEKWRKDPEKGGKAREEAIYQSAFSKITGVLLSIFAVDCLKGTIFDSREIPKNKDKKAASMAPAEAFLTWLLNSRPDAFRSYPRQLGLEHSQVAFYGFDVKEFTRVLGAECCLAGYTVPIGLWYQNEECFDPYDMLVEADRRKIFPLSNLLGAVGIATVDDYTPHNDAEEDCRVAAELIHSFGLIAKYDEEKLYGIVQDNLTPIDAIEGEDAEEVEEAEEAEEAEDAEETEEVDAEAEAEAEEEYEEVEVDADAEVDVEAAAYEDGEEEYEEEYEEEAPAPAPAPAPKKAAAAKQAAPPPPAPKKKPAAKR